MFGFVPPDLHPTAPGQLVELRFDLIEQDLPIRLRGVTVGPIGSGESWAVDFRDRDGAALVPDPVRTVPRDALRRVSAS